MSPSAWLRRPPPLTVRSKRVLAVVLGLAGVYVGVWAAGWPHGFYTAFPGLGHHWVSPTGPYDEHLVRDVGGLYLGLGVVTAWSVVRPSRDLLSAVGAGWLVFDVLHLGYHAQHLAMFDVADRIGNVVSLRGLVVVAALLLVPTRDLSP